jgi:hypothetical protein
MCIKESMREEDSTTPWKIAANTTAVCPRLHRSRSQPCFERARTCGIKRRIEDDFDVGNNLRPALDLAKMEEVSSFKYTYLKKFQMSSFIIFHLLVSGALNTNRSSVNY